MLLNVHFASCTVVSSLCIAVHSLFRCHMNFSFMPMRTLIAKRTTLAPDLAHAMYKDLLYLRFQLHYVMHNYHEVKGYNHSMLGLLGVYPQ